MVVLLVVTEVQYILCHKPIC